MAAVVHGLEDKYGETMNFVYLDTSKNDVNNIVDELGLYTAYVPTFFFINSEGEVTGQVLIGGQADTTLEQAIIDVLVEEGIFTK
jgi:hypothetical protein